MSNNPFQYLQKEYDTTLQNIKQAEIAEINNPTNRSLEQNYISNVNNFYKVKKEVSQLTNSMINNALPLDIPQLQEHCKDTKMYNMAYPNLRQDLKPLNPPPQQKPSLFVNDIFTGSQSGPVMNVLDMSNNYRSLAQGTSCDKNRNERALASGATRKKCINSSFSNRLNQAQFRSGSDVVAMQADNGNVYHFDNGNRAGAPLCSTAVSLNSHRDIDWTPQNLPVLTTMNKDVYVNNLMAQRQQQQECKQNQANQRANYTNYLNSRASGSLNNPNNPIWKPLDSKYLN